MFGVGWWVFAAMVVTAAACEPRRSAVCALDAPCPGASADACAAGPEARMYGRSAYSEAGKTCVVGGDEACRAASVACAVWGQCAAPAPTSVGGECPQAERGRDRDFLASQNVACGLGRTCVATSDADCRHALVCRAEGRCVALGGVCVAAAEADCRASDHCAVAGLCGLVGRACTARTSDDCRRSRACDDWGECGLLAQNGGCTSCDRSVECAREGLCARILSGDRCRATEPAHCQRSAACRSEGRCRPSQGACVR